jgi:hypothetical protein
MPVGMMMPFPFDPSMMMGGMQPQQDSDSGHVPPRVEIAFRFLQMCNGKSSPTYVPASEYHVEEFAGMKLTTEEETAAATACNLLNQYLAGQLPPDQWDRGFLRKKKKNDSNAILAAARELTQPQGHTQKMIPCNACQAQGRISKPPVTGWARVRRLFEKSTMPCPVCHGAKQLILVVPLFPAIQQAVHETMQTPGAVTVEVESPEPPS